MEIILDRYSHEYGVRIDIYANTQSEDFTDGRREFVGHSVNVEVKI